MEDREIIELYNARSESAITETQRKFGGYLLALAGRFLPREDAEECVQDAYLRAWNAIPPESPRELRPYLAKVTRNLAVDRVRRDRAERRGGGEVEQVLEELAQVTASAPDAFDAVSAKELGEYVNRFVLGLPEREADILVRRYYFAEPMAEIAARYGMTPNAVSVSLLRSRRKLERYLRKEGLI